MHKFSHGVEKYSMYFSLNKPYGTHWSGKAPTETGENGMARVGHKGRQFEEGIRPILPWT